MGMTVTIGNTAKAFLITNTRMKGEEEEESSLLKTDVSNYYKSILLIKKLYVFKQTDSAAYTLQSNSLSSIADTTKTN